MHMHTEVKGEFQLGLLGSRNKGGTRTIGKEEAGWLFPNETLSLWIHSPKHPLYRAFREDTRECGPAKSSPLFSPQCTRASHTASNCVLEV